MANTQFAQNPPSLLHMTHTFLSRWTVLVLLSMPIFVTAAPPIFKCVVRGSVTFQNTPCPAAETRPQPSAERLNAEAKKRREAQASQPTNPSSAAAMPVREPSTPSRTPVIKGAETFRCDGRTYCSQMSSCREATYFLQHCPGVKMDGNGDGVPCEEQWCGR